MVAMGLVKPIVKGLTRQYQTDRGAAYSMSKGHHCMQYKNAALVNVSNPLFSVTESAPMISFFNRVCDCKSCVGSPPIE